MTRQQTEFMKPNIHPGKSSCNHEIHEKHEMGNTWNQRIIHPAGEKEPLPKLFCFRVFRVFRGLNSGFKVHLSRRQFLTSAAWAGATLALWPSQSCLNRAATRSTWPIGVFSKVYQELKLNFEESAEVTAEAGLDGIDCPVRPGGQILPERATGDLPRLAEALRKRGKKVLLLTTAIQSASSPHAENILQTARKLGVKYYRLGYWRYEAGTPVEAQLNNIKAQLKDLAALNKELGTCGILQNHAGTNLVGAKVWDLYEIAKAFDPDQVAIAFDLSHALNELAQDWTAEFQKLQSHFRVAYIKDWKRGAGFVPFGQGELGSSGFFQLLKKSACNAPLSMHTEYDWAGKGRELTKAKLIKALQDDLRTLNSWLETA